MDGAAESFPGIRLWGKYRNDTVDGSFRFFHDLQFATTKTQKHLPISLISPVNLGTDAMGNYEKRGMNLSVGFYDLSHLSGFHPYPEERIPMSTLENPGAGPES